MPKHLFLTAACAIAFLPMSPASAQDLADIPAEDQGQTAFDGDWLSVGVGVGVSPSYAGSDDYVVFPVPLVQGRLGGVGIQPRGAGLALDFLKKPDEGPGFDFGPVVRLRSSRAVSIKDPVVKSLGKLDRALEIGPSAGVTFSKVLHDYDSLSINLDVAWDVLGAHDGMVVDPSITYFTPLSRGTAVTLSVNAEYGNDAFADYYYTVSPEASDISGLSTFKADGGFSKLGVLMLGAVDMNHNLADGGLALFAVAGYSRMLGDAKDSPFTSEVGSADQFIGAIGVGYTF